MHPVLSVTKTVYAPVNKPTAVSFIPPVGDQRYLYGEFPPDTETEVFPLLCPQSEFTLNVVSIIFAG